MSRFLCKWFQRVFIPVLVHAVKDTEEDSFAAVTSGKGTHGADAPAHFDKEPFDHIGGAQAAALCGRELKNRKQFLQIGFQANALRGERFFPSAPSICESAEALPVGERPDRSVWLVPSRDAAKL